MAKQTGDKFYMQMALDLAAQGVGDVEPNPAVGCVIIKGDRIIGKGYHKKFGGPHAEIEAINDCRKKRNSPKNATMYVTLEPCCHHGKTGPCSQAVIDAGIRKVVIAAKDPSPHVAGHGIKQLRATGIEVKTGCLSKEAKHLNRWFYHYALTRRPWVILKWAQSIDGKLAYKDTAANGQWISNAHSRKDVHALRRRCQAILTGVDTVIADDPQLTTRPAKGKYPLRVVADSNLRIPTNCKLLQPSKSQTLIFTTAVNKRKASAIARKGAEVITLKAAKTHCDIDQMLNELGKRGIQQLLVEAGPTLLTAFLEDGFANELQVYIAPKILAGSGTASISKAMARTVNELQLKPVDIKQFDNDTRITCLIE